MATISFSLTCGARTLVTTAVVLVRADQNFLAISKSGKITENSFVAWSLSANVKLCSAVKLAHSASARDTCVYTLHTWIKVITLYHTTTVNCPSILEFCYSIYTKFTYLTINNYFYLTVQSNGCKGIQRSLSTDQLSVVTVLLGSYVPLQISL